MSQCRPIIMVTHSTNFCSPGAVHLRFRFRRFGSDTCGTCFHPSPWIGRPNRRGGRAEPLFPHALWNCVDAVHADLPKTNNAVEGWHRGFSELLGSNHPSILKFISALQKEQSMNEMTMEQYIAGATPALGRRVYRDTAERIKTIVFDYSHRPLLNYLRGIAHNFNFQV